MAKQPVIAPTIPLILLVKNLQHAARQVLETELRALDMTVAQQTVLGALVDAPGASNAELARAAFVSPQSMGEILASLEKGGFVSRVPAAHNARILQTQLTPQGFKMARQGAAIARALEQRLTAALAPEELATLQALLKRVLGTLRPGEEEEKY